MHLTSNNIFFTFIWICSAFLFGGANTSAQNNSKTLDEQINAVQRGIDSLKEQQNRYLANIEDLKLKRIVRDLEQIALPAPKPNDMLIKHAAMILN